MENTEKYLKPSMQAVSLPPVDMLCNSNETDAVIFDMSVETGISGNDDFE